jgi:hypothetical protein
MSPSPVLPLVCHPLKPPLNVAARNQAVLCHSLPLDPSWHSGDQDDQTPPRHRRYLLRHDCKYNGREPLSLRDGGDDDGGRGRDHVRDRGHGHGHGRGRAPSPRLTFPFLHSPVRGS